MDPLTIAMGLAQFVPWLTKMLSGSDKAANVAQQVVNVAQAVTGTDNPLAALNAVQADPAKVLDFQQAMAAMQIDLEKAYLLDMQSARAMQISALGQDDKFSKRFVYWFAAAWSLFAMGFFTAVTFIDLPASGQRVADTILGVLITSVVGVMFAYFYGSTKGGEAKSAMLAKSSAP
jgi:hypothetical protein